MISSDNTAINSVSSTLESKDEKKKINKQYDVDILTLNRIKAYNMKKDFYNYIFTKFYYSNIRKELVKYMQHGHTTVMKHCRNVAYASYTSAKFLEKHFHIHFDYESLIIGGFLHDFFLYDWHEKSNSHRLHGFTHPKLASENAEYFCNASDKVKKIIESHMWPLTIRKVPKSREAILICLMDKVEAVAEVFRIS